WAIHSSTGAWPRGWPRSGSSWPSQGTPTRAPEEQMAVRAEEITNIIKDRIQAFGQAIQTTNVGTVIEVHDGVARIYGLSGALSGELLEFPGGIFGLALNLEEDTVGAVLLGDESGIKEGDEVRSTGRVVDVPVGDELIGRVVNAIGEP